ncbi:two component transcriptional regulator, winged helix family [mine drainage metagenome]|uniref:Two component transcriptional regulator, winged helix family n=1 Tax=mine drainage metagenome TaxID=410659 RepID=T1D5R1_9ZZZZ
MSLHRQRCLIIEDEPEIRHFLTVTLTLDNWNVEGVDSGARGLIRMANWRPDLVILDLGLPDMDGLDVLTRFRTWSEVPLIVLTARTLESVKIHALDAGADDYLTKPFSVMELTARIRSVMRRAMRDSGKAEARFMTPDWEVDLMHRRVWVRGQEVHLTPIEYRLLSILIKKRGRVLTHDQLLTDVWGPNHSDDHHYVRIYMAQLRKKIESDPAAPRYLITESGVGYRLVETDHHVDTMAGEDDTMAGEERGRLE